ncbi:hypothetical protein V1264_010548 [Littorina saxatilis]|uniref:Uncharacterized protein n=1 Tax=Littorina saxatilis TaxID=31220 RepID=A0AAN9APN6_9CAEN
MSTSSDVRTSAPMSRTDPGTRELLERLRFLEDSFESGAGGHRGHRMDHLSISVAPDVRRKIVEGKSIDLAILLAKAFMDRHEGQADSGLCPGRPGAPGPKGRKEGKR